MDKEALLRAATDKAIRAVDAARFFKTERGFHGRFYCALQAELDHARLLTNGAILEMEYQKSLRHDMSQRPDIVFHIPAEDTGEGVEANNFAVWALKRRATQAQARADFENLDQMFASLRYSYGFFINIDAANPMLEHYSGDYRDRLAAVAARLNGAQISVKWDLSNAEA